MAYVKENKCSFDAVVLRAEFLSIDKGKISKLIFLKEDIVLMDLIFMLEILLQHIVKVKLLLLTVKHIEMLKSNLLGNILL